MVKQRIFTPEGYKKAKEKLAALLQKRKQLTADLEEARALGDLSENSTYHFLRTQLVILENQLDELKESLAHAKIIEPKENKTGEVTIGSKVEISLGGKTRIIEIVGDGEADPLKGKISMGSPLAKALLGKKAGEEVKVPAPEGEISCRVVAVKN
ncbi:transcription elongation factor GreA [bacterium]|nr:transcription elongation factor GreA [bacterium]